MSLFLAPSISRPAISLFRPNSSLGLLQSCITLRGFAVSSARLAPPPRPQNGSRQSDSAKGKGKEIEKERTGQKTGAPASLGSSKKHPLPSKQAGATSGVAIPPRTIQAGNARPFDHAQKNPNDRKVGGLWSEGLSPAEAMRERRRERKLAQEKSEQDPGFSGPDQGEIVLSKEETELMQIVLERRKRILVPALWTLAFVSLIYTGCALAADRSSRKAASESTSDSGSSDSGIFAGANKGFLGTFQWAKDRFGPEIFFPCILWESLAFIPGERYRTLFTYAFAHSSGAALFLNGLFVIGFMPPVIRYFDGDRFHTVAFFLSVPIIAGFVLHFPYRIGAQAMGISMELGASGAVYGLLGVLCAAHWNESTYRDWSISQGRCMFVYLALVELFAWRNGSVLVSHLGHLTGLLVGTAYVYFDAKNKIWVPLCRKLGKKEKTPPEPDLQLPY